MRESAEAGGGQEVTGEGVSPDALVGGRVDVEGTSEAGAPAESQVSAVAWCGAFFLTEGWVPVEDTEPELEEEA